ncbi:hypothetical protein HK097_005706, partial [Rhizophlyctis rosea]
MADSNADDRSDVDSYSSDVETRDSPGKSNIDTSPPRPALPSSPILLPATVSSSDAAPPARATDPPRKPIKEYPCLDPGCDKVY